MRLALDLHERRVDVVPLQFLTGCLALHLRDQAMEFLLELLEARGGFAGLAALFQET